MPKKKTSIRKSDYNPNRLSYMSVDGKYYCYDSLDKSGRTVKIEITPELEEITLMLDEMDHAEDLQDRYQHSLTDTEFNFISNADPNKDHIQGIADPNADTETILFKEEMRDLMVDRVREIVDNELTEDQRLLFFSHYGMNMRLTEIAREEAEQTGKTPGASAMSGRKRRLEEKVARALGERMPKKLKK